ncbi:probable phospholipid hydroperoxide glutathione peroxidase [Salvia splendens]|uniref:probable phospholipid hydroperoxide glutathione peroxidase n=1 Tax=Salvia splendens TaxID=180675 RepID=UPI001C25F834|nr:probable phospholipid hydroperoxide glutathione peroxidase [Salvia splendens]
MGNSSSSITEGSIHDFVVKDTKDQDVSLDIYKGKVLLIVNVASQCRCTNSNYTELAELYTQFKDKGLEILAFPCEQFSKKEPGSSQDAEQFACTRFNAEFPMFQKVKVNGANAAPVYKFLKSNKKGHFGGSIKWNFTKFLVDRDGHVINRYGTTTSPVAIAVSLSLSHTPLSLIDTAKFCIALQDDIKKALGDET